MLLFFFFFFTSSLSTLGHRASNVGTEKILVLLAHALLAWTDPDPDSRRLIPPLYSCYSVQSQVGQEGTNSTHVTDSQLLVFVQARRLL